MSEIKRRPEVFDPKMLEFDQSPWSLEYGVPLETVTYVADRTFLEDPDGDDPDFTPGLRSAMNE